MSHGWRFGPINRSHRRESALIHCFKNKQVRRLTSAATRFMGRGHLQNPDVNRSHEPVGIPLNRRPGTFSPTGEKDGMRGVRFIERAEVSASPDSANRSVGLARYGLDLPYASNFSTTSPETSVSRKSRP